VAGVAGGMTCSRSEAAGKIWQREAWRMWHFNLAGAWQLWRSTAAHVNWPVLNLPSHPSVSVSCNTN
jgi:hypothetical protein